MTEASEFNYNWWLESSKIAKMEYLIKNESKTDCTFVFKHDDSDVSTKDGELKSHKWILIGASEVFQAMFKGNFKEGSEEIEIRDAEIGVFEKFLRLLYFAGYKELQILSAFNLISLAYLGKKYMIDALVENCNKTIHQKLDSNEWSDEELVVIFRFARLNEDEDLLKMWKRIMAAYEPFTKMFPSTLYELDAKQMYDFLDALKGIASEPHRFRMIEMYAKDNDIKVQFVEKSNDRGNKDADNKESDTKNDKARIEFKDEAKIANEMYLKLMIQNIDFDIMSYRQFCLGPVESELLSDAEKVEKFKRICLGLVESELLSDLEECTRIVLKYVEKTGNCYYCGRANTVKL